MMGQEEEKKEENKERKKKEKEEEEEKKLAHTGRDQPKVVQEVLADLKTFPSNIKLYEEKFHFPA